MSHSPDTLSVVHIASGDLWAGAEVQLYTLLGELQRNPQIEVSAILLNHGELQARLAARGIPVTVYPETTFNPLQLYARIHAQLAKQRPRLVHTHRVKENVLAGIAAWRLGIPSVRSVHGASEHPPRGLRQAHKHIQYHLDAWVGRRLQRRVIAVTDELRQKLTVSYPPAMLATAENGLDIEGVRTAAAPPAALREAAPQAVHVGIVGRLEPVKRVDLFLETAARLATSGGQWYFHVLGDGALRTQLRAHATALGLDNLHFHGHRGDIPACLAALDALVMCSDHEGLPMTLLEALAVGTPVVAHDTGGLRLVLQGGAGGLLVSDHQPSAYAEALQQLVAMAPERRKALIDAGQARLNEHYTATANARKIEAIYRQVLTERT